MTAQHQPGLGILLAALCVVACSAPSLSVAQVEPNQPVGGSAAPYSSISIISDEQLARLGEPLINRPGSSPIHLPLEECIRRALEHNLDIQISGYDPAISMTDLVQAEAAFDAIVFGSTSFDNVDQGNRLSTFFTEETITPGGVKTERIPNDPFIRTHDYNYSLGLRKRLPTGAAIQVAQFLRRFRDLRDDGTLFYDPFYEWTLDVQMQQPLLRDFGIDVNRTAINAGRANYQASQQQFQLAVIATLVEVEGNYWQLVQFRQQVLIFEYLIAQTRRIRDRLKQREVLDTRTNILRRNDALLFTAESNLTEAINGVLQAQDQLLESLNDPELAIRQNWEILTDTQPNTQPYLVDRDLAIEMGLQMRREIIIQDIQIELASLRIGLAENQILPRLDLFLQQAYSGASADAGKAWDTQNRLNQINYSGGINFELPLGGNRAAKADLVRANLLKTQVQLRKKSIEELIIMDVSGSQHELAATYQELLDLRLAAEAQTDAFRAYQASEDAEAAITADFLNSMIDSLERVSVANQRLARIIFRHNMAILNINRAEGVLLRFNNIKLAELPEQ